MKHVATALLFDRDGKLLIYLRDNKPTIPFPDHWDLFGGHVDEGETPQDALVRELKEELSIKIDEYAKFRDYVCTEGDIYPNVKHVYYVKISVGAEELTLNEGQRLVGIDLAERGKYKFANILATIIDDFACSGFLQEQTQ